MSYSVNTKINISTSSSPTYKYDDAVKGVKKDPRSIQKCAIKLESKPLGWRGNKANIAQIKEQAELRGYRFTYLQTKGGVVPGSGSMTNNRSSRKQITYEC